MPFRFRLIIIALLLSVSMWVDRACISAAKDDTASDWNLTDGKIAWVMAALAMPIMVGLIQVSGGWRAMFLPFSILGGVFANLRYAFLGDQPEDHPWMKDSKREHFLKTRGRSGDASVAANAPRMTTGGLLRSRNMGLLMLQCVAHNFTFLFTVTWFFPSMMSTNKRSPTQTRWMSADVIRARSVVR